LSPEGKANKSLVYHLAVKHDVKIVDHGDIINLTWRKDCTQYINLEILKSAEEV
jgi:hypothetical protein